MEWIDIRDRLPEKDGRYLIVRGGTEPCVDIMQYSIKLHRNNLSERVTHWAPLPELPKAQKQDHN